MQDIVILAAVCFGIPVLICLLLSQRWRRPSAALLAVAACAVVTINILVVGLVPELPGMEPLTAGLKWNWFGKLGTILASVAMFLLLPQRLKVEAGVLTLPRPPEWKSVIAVSAGLLAFFWAVAFAQRSGGTWTGMTETVAFQGTLPGLDEELAFRGIVLALLVAAFGKPWRFLGISVGWGALPLIAFFGLVHGYTSFGTGLDWFQVFVTGVAGVGLLWLKERTGSIWVAVIVHNLMNVGSLLQIASEAAASPTAWIAPIASTTMELTTRKRGLLSGSSRSMIGSAAARMR